MASGLLNLYQPQIADAAGFSGLVFVKFSGDGN